MYEVTVAAVNSAYGDVALLFKVLAFRLLSVKE